MDTRWLSSPQSWKSRYAWFVFIVVCLLSPRTSSAFDGSDATAGSQEKKAHQIPVPVEAIIDMNYLVEDPVSISPDGEMVAYVLSGRRPSVESAGKAGEDMLHKLLEVSMEGRQVWVADTKSGVSRNISVGLAGRWSPDSRRLAFYSRRDGGVPKLYVWERATGAIRKVCDQTVVDAPVDEGPQWTADGRRLVIKIAPKRNDRNDQHNTAAELAIVGHPLVLSSTPNAGEKTESKREGFDPSNLSVSKYGDLNKGDLVIVVLRTGEVEKLAGGLIPSWYGLSPDGKDLSVAEYLGSCPNTGFGVFRLRIINLDSRESRAADSRLIQYYEGLSPVVSWSPDSSKLAFVSPEIQRGETPTLAEFEARFRVFLLDRGSLQARKPELPKGWLPNGNEPLWEKSGKAMYIHLKNASSDLKTLCRFRMEEFACEPPAEFPYSIDMIVPSSQPGEAFRFSGEDSAVASVFDNSRHVTTFYRVRPGLSRPEELLETRQRVSRYRDHETQGTADGHFFIFGAQDAQTPKDLWLFDAALGKDRRLTFSNPALNSVKMGELREVSWFAPDGGQKHGALLLPSTYEEGQKCPLIVYIYGGQPLSADGNIFGMQGNALGYAYMNGQLLATRGYAFLGIDTYKRLGAPMTSLAQQTLAAVNRVVELGYADPERLGIIGTSYGGYSVLAVVTQTERFKAGVSLAGFASMTYDYEHMTPEGMAPGLDWVESRGDDRAAMGGSVWEYRDRYIENSPFYYFDRITTPLLIFQGAEDPDVAAFEGDFIFNGLRRLGKRAEYRRYPGEGHAFEFREDQIDFANRMIEWFDEFVKGIPWVSSSEGR